MYLSKSKYCAGQQCPKILWMDQNMPEQKTEQDDSRMKAGLMVGDLAMGYFGAFTEVPFDHEDMGGMIDETKRLLEAGTAVITEASFSYDGNFCSVDILRKTAGDYEIVEVKSSSGEDGDESDKIKQEYFDDIAYQYYVVSHSGLNISKISLMQLNREYIRHGVLDLQKLFVLTDCTEIVLNMQKDIPENIANIKAVATQKGEPAPPIGSRCKGCAYKGWCFRDLPKNNVFDIGWGMRGSKKDEAYNSGYVSFEGVLNSSAKLSEHQLLQVKTVVNNLPPHIEPYSIHQFLNGLSYPLYHLDFETIQPTVPPWNGIKPYQQIPFQYSLHIQGKPCAEPVHREFLAKEGEDPRRAVAERLCADIPKNVCVLAFNAGFEKGRLKELAGAFPDLSAHLLNIRDNVKDLADPFSKGYYYCREMGGSYSIKVVLPALCGGDPELDYHALDLIHNGSEAMNAFLDLHKRPPEEIAKVRAALLAYCRLDTLAMVKVLEKLYEAVK
jgi:CRISPR/Cas system-associated exonuclease Cas4 (RecB family)